MCFGVDLKEDMCLEEIESRVQNTVTVLDPLIDMVGDIYRLFE